MIGISWIMSAIKSLKLTGKIFSFMMGTMTIIEEAGEIEQSGYGVFSDLLTIIEEIEN